MFCSCGGSRRGAGLCGGLSHHTNWSGQLCSAELGIRLNLAFDCFHPRAYLVGVCLGKCHTGLGELSEMGSGACIHEERCGASVLGGGARAVAILSIPHRTDWGRA